MNFFKKLLSKKTPKKTEPNAVQKNVDIEHTFIQHFLQKGGKFLYCTNKVEVAENLQHIFQENNWDTVSCISEELKKTCATLPITLENNSITKYPFLTACEHLIAENGSILFSSEQISDIKLHELNTNFIVFAKTSQLVKSRGEGLTGIKATYKKELPTNISALKNYLTQNLDNNFMDYGNNNAKNLYLLLLEDL